ncbi:hypothetical protein ALP10_01608 [Pseudomonas syringae pv. helianthi]|uniref:YD repeat protein n=1 Tax=Pseudomonas syringae pv. helianthi TaxID=251654 RepID=A0A3M6CH83_9PSED|nr:RHS repeat-associated core domain-containing protein [Pseudomonas syringae group genomosp. 7]RMV43245.1 hypothetical protein ALP10_01608 [Pseudomonas syringae pv. helianthi]
MASSGQSVLCVYRYDPLDRLADCSPVGEGSIGLFYQKSHLATQIHEQIQHTLLRTGEHLLAQRRTEHNQSACVFLITDQQQSVIAAQGLAFAYTPYGHRHPSAGPMNLPGFTGQRVDPVTGHYLLGNGYRAFNPVLMRFNSPDSLSPFGEGGLNAYAYCGGDPVNGADPSGHVPKWFKNFFGKGNSRRRLSGSQDTLPPSPITVASIAQSSQPSYSPPVVPHNSPQLSSNVDPYRPRPRPASPPPYTPRDTTTPPRYTPREIAAPLPSVPPPPYVPLPHGQRLSLRPPIYTPDASPDSFMPSFNPNGNYQGSAPASTRPTSDVEGRVRDAVQNIRDRGLDY